MAVEEVLAKLKAEGLIQIDSNPEKTVTYLKKRSPVEQDQFRNSDNTFVARLSYRMANDAHVDTSEFVVQRCKEWITDPLNKPKTEATLRSCLEQLCLVKEEINTDVALEMMVQQGLIEIDLDDKVIYKTKKGQH